MKTNRIALPWAPRGGGSPWWLAAVAGLTLAFAALATCIGLVTRPPLGRGATPGAGGGATPVAAVALDSAADDVERADAAEEIEARRAAEATDGAPRDPERKPARAGSERWHLERLRALAASDLDGFRREARERFDAAASNEQFAFLRVALASDAPLADELGRTLLEQGRRDDDDRFAATVTLLQKQAARANDAAKSLLATLTPEEARRFSGRLRGEPEGGNPR